MNNLLGRAPKSSGSTSLELDGSVVNDAVELAVAFHEHFANVAVTSSSSSFGGASLPRQMGGPRPRVYPFTTLATKLLGSDADCKGLQPASCFVIQNH